MRLSSRFALPLALALALPLTLHAQVVVRGTVVDQGSGAPVAGALVRVPATAVATTTSDSGTFSLTSARAVTALTVSRLGYITQDVAVAGTEPLRITLVPTSVELPGVQVLAHNPAPSTAQVTRADIERFSGIDLPSVVNTIPGVFMQSRTPFGGARITIRGYYPSTSGNSPNSNGLGYQVFLNQIPLTDATGSTVLDDVDYASMGNIEIIKGPASSLYGSPIGGTVNFTLARPTPNQTSVHQLVLGGGGDGLLRTNTSVERASATSDFVVNYGNQQDNSFRPHSRSRKSFVRANGDVAVGSDQNVSAFFTYNRSFEELAGEIDSGAFYARLPQANAAYLANDSHIQLTSFFTGVTDNYRISDRFSNQTSVFGNGRFSNQPFAHGYTDATLFNWGARSAFAYTGQAGGVDISGRLGAQAQRSQITSNGVFIVPAPPFPERPSATENYAVNAYAFTEWNFSLPGAVTLTAGADLIHNTFAVHNLLRNGQLFDTTKAQTRTFPTVLAPRLQIQKGIAPHASLYASVSTGYTPPLLTNVVASDNSVNLGLEPERAVQYEIGAQGSALDQRLTGQVALFDLDNTHKLVNQTVNSVTSTVNIGKQRNAGAELSASYQFLASATDAITLLRPWLSYTYMDAKYVDFKSDANNNAGTVSFSDNRVARVPRHQVSAGVDLSTHVGVYVNSTYQFVGRVPVTFDNSTWVRSYSLLGAKLGYKTMLQKRYQLDVAVGGDNLTNSTYYTFLFVGPNYKGLAQAQDGGNGDGYIIPGFYKARYYLSANLSVSIM